MAEKDEKILFCFENHKTLQKAHNAYVRKVKQKKFKERYFRRLRLWILKKKIFDRISVVGSVVLDKRVDGNTNQKFERYVN